MNANAILVATDFSPPSEVALQLGTSLARDTGAMLHIVHVLEPNAAYKLDGRYESLASPFPDLAMLMPVLQKVVPADANVPFRHWLFENTNVADEIVDLAERLGADFIVMGSDGRTGLPRMLLGSVAESVLRNAHCPVLTVKHPKPSLIEPVTGRLPS